MSNLKIALTGSIACGKSSVSKILHKMGVVIISLDELSHKVVRPNTSGLAALVSAFGNDILNPDKTLNRAKLRQLLLANVTNQQLIEDILHPPIFAKMHANIAQCKEALVVVEIPRLTSVNIVNFDRVIVVKCNSQKQLKRLTKRDNITQKDAKNRMTAQINQINQNNINQQIPTDVLENNADIEHLTQKVQDLYAKLINL